MWNRAELKEKAKFALKQNYWKIVLVCVILSLLGYGGTPDIELNYEVTTPTYYDEELTSDIFKNGTSLLYNMGFMTGVTIYVVLIAAVAIAITIGISVFVGNPIEMGARRFFVKSLNGTADMNELLFGFNNNYKNVVKVLFFQHLYIFLWTLLFIIPGFIKSYEYAMVSYLLTENPNLEKDDALQMSKEMMYGHKMELFMLQLSFIGWDILGAFTLGLLHTFYVEPYRNLTIATFFEKLNAASGYPARRANGYGYQQVPPFNTTDEI